MIPQIEPWIDDAELEQLKEVIADRWVTEGKKTQAFEESFLRFTGAKHVISACNGTVGLYMALKAAGIGQGDEVIVPDLTFIASANAVIMAGATPVFADIDRDTLNLDPAAVRLTARTKAIMPVHLYGAAADLDPLLALARERSLIVIEDAAQGVGVAYKGRHVGTLGQIGVLSFYGNKVMTCGEGGLVLTNDPQLAKRCWQLKNHGREVKGTFIHPTVGFNFCMTDLQAAVGLAQFQKLPEIIRRKQRLRDRYASRLEGLPGLQLTKQQDGQVHWFTSVLVDDPQDLQDFLKERGVQTRRFFYPLHRQPAYASFPKADYPNADWAYDHGLSLPSSVTLPDQDQEKVCQEIAAYCKR